MTDTAGESRLRAAVLALLERMREEERRFERELCEEERRERGTPRRWGARAMLAHVADSKRQQAERVEAIAQGAAPPPLPLLDHGDPAAYARSTKRSWDEVERAADAATERLRSATCTCTSSSAGSSAAVPRSVDASTRRWPRSAFRAERRRHRADRSRRASSSIRSSRV